MTNKTKNYIIYLIKSEMPELFKRIPQNTYKHKDTRINYQHIILEESLGNINQQHANVIINLINQGNKKGVEQYIFGINGIEGIK